MHQRTLAHKISCTGTGLHGGKKVNLTLNPAPIDHGIKFKRIDITYNENIIDARFDNVNKTVLSTTISNGKTEVNLIEHLMAALYGCGIDNCLIEIDGAEVPIMDGSSEHFVFMIETAGMNEQDAKRKYFRIEKTIKVERGKSFIEFIPADEFEINLSVEYENILIGKQNCDLYNNTSFKHEVSRARTFCMANEIDMLKAQGLAKGGSLENAIVVAEDRILNDGALRFENEFARHKLLDCIGDMYMAGHIIGKINVYCPGHAINNIALRELFKNPENIAII